MKNIFFLFLIFIFATNIKAQNSFNILGHKKKVVVPFKLVNNLILFPAELNNQKLTFIFDTGVRKSLLFNVSSVDSIILKQTKKIKIRGLGIGNYYNAIKSNNNIFKVKNIISPNFEIFLIVDNIFDFSARMGTNVHGLIGTDFIKNFVVTINYKKHKLTFTKIDKFKIKKRKKWQKLNLTFQNGKPYIKANFSKNTTQTSVNLLIDSGAGDALWLFENKQKNIFLPQKNIHAFLGSGLSGDIFGKKARVSKFNIGNFRLNDVIVAYPDSTSIKFLSKNLKRDGTLGSEILKRFHLILDYSNKAIYLRKNTKYKNKFLYDKSGLGVMYNGKMLVLESKIIPTYTNEESKEPTFSYAYNYVFKNSYIVAQVDENSVAFHAGLKKEDIILALNNEPIYNYNLQQIIQKLSSKNNSIIDLLVLRNNVELKFTFKLKDLL